MSDSEVKNETFVPLAAANPFSTTILNCPPCMVQLLATVILVEVLLGYLDPILVSTVPFV